MVPTVVYSPSFTCAASYRSTRRSHLRGCLCTRLAYSWMAGASSARGVPRYEDPLHAKPWLTTPSASPMIDCHLVHSITMSMVAHGSARSDEPSHPAPAQRHVHRGPATGDRSRSIS